MARPVLDEAHIHPAIRDKVTKHHEQILQEVRDAISNNRVVVVGMKVNPHPKRAVAALKAKGIAHRYLEYGSYVSMWRPRTALKMWTGWPTFPMCFVDGVLVGGANELIALIEKGELVA
ncbi:MAG: glutaredoxin [Myxococcales bacterium]|nr:glutaredoxin [Myxococcales bacterium]